MIRIVLPYHLRTLARVSGEVEIEVAGQATQRSVLDALEICYPMLRGTIRDHVTQQGRPFVRFFAASRVCPTNYRTPRCPTQSPWGRNRRGGTPP